MAQLNDKTVWDDSALVDSWNEALNEYKKYHSIHAKGGSIRDLERERPDANGIRPSDGLDGTATGEPNAPVGGESEEEGEIVSMGDEHPANGSSTGGFDLPLGDGEVHPLSTGIPTQALLGSIQDENLKRLLMAWYYAGYYLGLYQGHQQAQQPPL